MPAACFLQDVMQPETMDLDTLGNVKQEFPENAHFSKLVCFFCDKDFSGVQVLHSHQKECALASNSQKILIDTRNSIGKKRSFLSYLNLIPKVNAEHVRSEKRKDVVLDVIVIDDDSDDENRDITKDKSQRYLLSPNSSDSKTKQIGRLRSKNKNCNLGLSNAFTKPSSKVFKFDISSPLGTRLRYHCKQIGNCRLPQSKICRANYEYELYCGTTTTKTPHSNKCYHVVYRKSRQPSKFCHQYKFTRAQLRESCRAQRSGLSLSSLRLKRHMKPCRISVEKLNLPCDNASRGTFDARPYMRMLNLKLDIESSAKVSDEDVATTKMQTVVDAVHEPSFAVRRNGSSSIFENMQVSESHQLGVDRMRESLEHPVRTYHKFRLRGIPDAHPSLDVFSPIVSSLSDSVGFANKRVELPRAFASNVEFVPLTSLYAQSVLDDENHDPHTRMFEISNVVSLATSEDFAESLSCDLPTEQYDVETIVSSCEILPPENISSSTSSADIITIVDHDNSTLEATEQLSQVKEGQSMFHRLPVGATDVIDLTENVSSSIPVCSEAEAAMISQQTVVESAKRIAQDDLRDILHQLSEELCKSSSEKSQKSPDVHKLPTEKSSGLQTSHLQKELERPIVIEIPDDDIAVSTKQLRNPAIQSQSNYCNGINNNNASGATNNLEKSNSIATLPSQRVPNKSSHSAPPMCHSVQPAILARDRRVVQTSDTIDLSFDSDTEILDKEPVATGQKRPLPSNSDSCPPKKRDRPGVPLENSLLPPLTFKCHICGCFFNFDNNSGTMIRKHYLMHNVTNIELVKQVLPNGQTTWSLVELNGIGQTTHAKPSGPASCASAPHSSISHDHVGMTRHHTPSVASSLRSAVPEFVSLEQSCVPENLSPNPSATQRSSPGTTRLNSDKNCNMLPVKHLPPIYASSVPDTTSTLNDAGLSQVGRRERKDVRFQNQIEDAKTLRAIHVAQLCPNVSSSARVLRPNVPCSTRILQPNVSSSTRETRPNVPRSTPVLAGPRPTTTSAEHREQFYFPMNAKFNRVLVDRERGDANVINQMQSKHNALASIKSNNNIVHGVICLD